MAVRNPTASDVRLLLRKYDDPDSDIRFMIMSDLKKMFENGQGQWLGRDMACSNEVVEVLLKALDDGNGDVQSAALGWYTFSFRDVSASLTSTLQYQAFHHALLPPDHRTNDGPVLLARAQEVAGSRHPLHRYLHANLLLPTPPLWCAAATTYPGRLYSHRGHHDPTYPRPLSTQT